MKTNQQTYGTVLIKANQILHYLSSCDHPQRLNEISLETNISKSTVLKILDTLLLIGYVQRDPETKKFSLGPALIRFANRSMSQLDIKEIAQPFLEKLSKKTTETVHLGILDKDRVIYITKIESSNPVALYSKVGRSIPLYCSAMGKAILAEKSSEEIENYLSSTVFVKKTNNTITTKEAFIEELNRIRLLGYAFDDGEHEEEVFCVGASITLNGKNYGAISVSVPKYRITTDSLQRIIVSIKQCQKDIVNEIEQIT